MSYEMMKDRLKANAVPMQLPIGKEDDVQAASSI